MTTSIIIAKYNENISWINNIDKKHTIHIYNKSDENISSSRNNTIIHKLQNVGRETHTYLTHIINNYDNLTDLVLFTQGKWDDHQCATYLTDLFKTPNSFNKQIISFNHDFRLTFYYTSLEKEKDELCLGLWVKKYIESDIDYYLNKDGYFCNLGAIFCIKKENILSRPLEFYKDLLRQVDGYLNPEVGHYFERTWYYIFNIHKYP